jgi:hypothetical protein
MMHTIKITNVKTAKNLSMAVDRFLAVLTFVILIVCIIVGNK